MIREQDKDAQDAIPSTEDPNSKRRITDTKEIAKLITRPISHKTRLSSKQEDEPYGRDWDVIWLGHCGTELPPPSYASSASMAPSQDRLMLASDETVPDPKALKRHHSAPPDELGKIYPPHTRVYHRSYKTLCTVAYAVTQRGARKIMYEHGMRNLDKGYDFALSEWCDGKTKNSLTQSLRPMCLTTSPPIRTYPLSSL